MGCANPSALVRSMVRSSGENAYIRSSTCQRYCLDHHAYLIITPNVQSLCTAPKAAWIGYHHPACLIMVCAYGGPARYKVLLQCGVSDFRIHPGFCMPDVVSDAEVALKGHEYGYLGSFYLHSRTDRLLPEYRWWPMCATISAGPWMSPPRYPGAAGGVPLSNRFARALLKLFSPML